MESHLTNLKQLCRFCGQKQKVRPFYSKYKKTLRHKKLYDEILANSSEVPVPEEKFCTSCNHKLVNLRILRDNVEAVKVADQLKKDIHVFSNHQDHDCFVCNQFPSQDSSDSSMDLDIPSGNEAMSCDSGTGNHSSGDNMSTGGADSDDQGPSPPRFQVVSQRPQSPARRPHRSATSTSNLKFIEASVDGKTVKLHCCPRAIPAKYFMDEAIARVYLCTLCGNVSQDPVLSPCGHSYCRLCLANVKKHGDKCFKYWVDKSCDGMNSPEVDMNPRERSLFSTLKVVCPRCSKLHNFAEERDPDHLTCHINKQDYTKEIVDKMKWNWMKESVSIFARENELGDPFNVALQLALKFCAEGQNLHVKKQIEKIIDILNGVGVQQHGGLAAMKGLILKIFCNLSCKQYVDIRAFFIKNSEIFGLEKHFLPSYKQVVKEQKRAGPSNTPYVLWKDGAILLEHEACQEEPLNILDTFKKRNPAMGTPNLCGYYFRMTDLVASQLFHLADIVRANSSIRGSNLEEVYTVTLKLSEDGFGSVQGCLHPEPRPNSRKRYLEPTL